MPRLPIDGRTFLFYTSLVVCSIPLVPFFLGVYFLPHRLWWPLVLLWLNLVLFLLKWVSGVTYEISGRENLPKEPHLLASGHESVWEVLFYQMFFGNPVAFTKRAIFSYPFAGPMAHRYGHIPVEKESDLEALRTGFALAKAAVAKGRSVLIFPSGSRNRALRGTMHKGVAALYRVLNVPCVPIVIDSGRCWPHDTWPIHPGVIHVRILPPIAPGLSAPAFMEALGQQLSQPADIHQAR